MTRKEIMNICPEGFEDELSNDIKDYLDIKRLDDLDNIGDAYDIASDMSSDLY